jgi:hypothetical protein
MDNDDGSVHIKGTPNFETMLKQSVSGESLTPGQVYGVHLLLEARRFSEKLKREASPLLIPRSRRTV